MEHKVDTQRIRVRLIQELVNLFDMLEPRARRDPETARVLAYIGQTLNSLCRSYDNRELDEELKALESLIEKIRSEREHGSEAEEDSDSH